MIHRIFMLLCLFCAFLGCRNASVKEHSAEKIIVGYLFPQNRKIDPDAAVRKFIAAGVPAEKIVLGVAFYGRTWGNVPPEHNGLYVHGETLHKPVHTAHVFLKPNLVNKNGYIRYWDDISKAPFLYNPDEKIFISYDDAESITEKCRYIQKMNLLGAMFWEYHCDYESLLLDTIVEGLKKGD